MKEPCLGDHIHVMAEEIRQIHQQPAKIKLSSARLEIDQEDDFTPAHRVRARLLRSNPERTSSPNTHQNLTQETGRFMVNRAVLNTPAALAA